VSVAEEKLSGEQPLVTGTISVSQVTKMQIEKSGKRDLDTVVDTSNKGDICVRKAGLTF